MEARQQHEGREGLAVPVPRELDLERRARLARDRPPHRREVLPRHGPPQVALERPRRRRLFCISMVGLAARRGAWALFEHPQDRGEPYPSFFCSQPMHDTTAAINGLLCVFDQCLFGAPARKGTQVMTNVKVLTKHLQSMGQHRNGLCDHLGGHRPAIGLKHGGFQTTR